MREIERKTPRRYQPDYKRPGGPANKEPSPRRGLKQRWTADSGITFAKRRRDAIERAVVHGEPAMLVFI